MLKYEYGKPARSGDLNIGLAYYQELQWLSAIKLYGKSITDNSLLTTQQKEALVKEATK